jgi:hypothetical protein
MEIKSVKIYNLQFHLLRAANPDPITSPINTRQGANLFEKVTSILHVLTSHPNLVGGLRVEVRTRMTLLNDAINLLIERQMFKPQSYNVNVTCLKVMVNIYLLRAQQVFRTARAILTRPV